jgi:hypothetical protein
MPHLIPVPDPDPAEYFTTTPICPTCPPHLLGFNGEWRPQGWEVTLWHKEPCPQESDPPARLLVPACETCHTWAHADFQFSDLLLPGVWAFSPKHGRTPITSQDGTIETAAGGEYCPQMKIDNAVILRLAGLRVGADGVITTGRPE